VPRLNLRGQALGGMGLVSICDGPGQPPRVIGPGNHAVWLDDDRAIYGAGNGSLWSVWVYDQRTGQTTVLDPRTHDWLAGGGGVWGAVGPGGFFGSLPLDAGMRLSLTGTDSRGACSRDGTLAIVRDTSGLGFTLIAPSGEATDGAPGFAAYGLSVVGPTQAIWPREGVLTTLNLPTPLHIGPSGEARWCVVDGRAWVVHYLEDVGLVARPIDSNVGLIIETRPTFYHYDATAFNGTIRVTYSTTAGEAPDQIVVKDLVLADARPLVVTPPPPPPPPFTPRPLSPPRTDDGTQYDLARFFLGASSFWPRRGPAHQMHQPILDNGAYALVKYANLDDGRDGSRYELWAVAQHWLLHLLDASAGDPYRFSDPRWFPRFMQIGEAHAFDTGAHERIVYDRATCRVIDREPFTRRMWLLGVYDQFDWGPELGILATGIGVYDPTGGAHGPDRGIELYYGAVDPGIVRWELHRSDVVYPSRGSPAQFTDASRIARSDFYELGGIALPPKPGCVPLDVVPDFPPPGEEPVPEPEPPPPPKESRMIQLSVPSYINWRWGGGQSLEPPTNPNDPDRRPFEFGRTVAAGDETCELVSLTNNEYAVRSPNGRSWLSVQPDGSLQERDAAGEPGDWERFLLTDGVLIEKAKDGITRPPVEFLS
jgi:hypothetical protein